MSLYYLKLHNCPVHGAHRAARCPLCAADAECSLAVTQPPLVLELPAQPPASNAGHYSFTYRTDTRDGRRILAADHVSDGSAA